MNFTKEKINSINDVDVYAVTFINDNDFSITFYTYGGYIHNILIPYKNEPYKFEDVILGYNNFSDCLEAPGYFNSIIGRVGNRISNSEFELNNQKYKLSKNIDPNHLHGGIEGFNKKIWKINNVNETQNELRCELKYFSVDTHTIYPPKLTFKWDDSIYITGSGTTTLTSGDIFLALYNNKEEFQRKSKQRFRLTTRKRYPDRAFVTSSNYLDTQYLPTTSYYSLRDATTDEVVIPFDTSYTKLSADSDGMYFDLWMEGLQPERYYKLQFRVDNTDGINIYDEDYYFKVVR